MHFNFKNQKKGKKKKCIILFVLCQQESFSLEKDAWVLSNVLCGVDVLLKLKFTQSHSLTFKWCFYLTATSHGTFAMAFLSACFSKALWVANGSMELHKELLKFYPTNCCPLPSDP